MHLRRQWQRLGAQKHDNAIASTTSAAKRPSFMILHANDKYCVQFNGLGLVEM
jgi:hypothetical protein